LLVVADHPPSAFGVVQVVSERGTDRQRREVVSGSREWSGVRSGVGSEEKGVRRGGHFSG
jgi:hypothetical protein